MENSLMLNLSGMGPADLMELLTEKCEVHDWTFMMANGNAYYKGLAKADEINYISGVLDAIGFDNAATHIIEKFKPESLKTKGYLV